MSSEFETAFMAYVTASEDNQQEKLDTLVAVCKREGIRSVRFKWMQMSEDDDVD